MPSIKLLFFLKKSKHFRAYQNINIDDIPIME